jgi:hypothetical protein
MSRGMDEHGEGKSRSHGEVIHQRRGHQAPEESERQKDERVHGSVK